MRYQHGGNLDELARQAGCRADEILDFSANLNPLGPPGWLRQELSRNIEALAHYPPPQAEPFIDAIAQRYGLPPETLVAGNGSSELLYALPWVCGCRRAVIPVPAYGDYLAAARQARLEVVTPRLSAAHGFRLQPDELGQILTAGDLVLLGRPANPTATLPDAGELRALARAHPDCLFLVDEAFVDFLAVEDTLLYQRPENVVVLRSMTKFYAVPGLRLGFVALAPHLAAALRDQLPAWSVNILAQAVGVRALADDEYATATRQCVTEYRTQLESLLGGLPGLRRFPSSVNYLLVEAEPPAPDAVEIARRCLCEHRIAIRVCANYEGLGRRYFRLAVRTPAENERLAGALHEVLGLQRKAPARAPHRRCPALMIQGTTSNAGKSVLTAAFCRILAQDGIRVAPFKAQNMSLNSFVTRTGGEMGRAQVVQAQACHLDPDVRMNPILLKPNSETGSQVIVLGQPVGNMVVGVYTSAKARLREAVLTAYDSLAAEYDAIVLEGAGSPAEVNLKKHDLVNMPMARHAQAPVLLVGDIDRGGVYAAFIGTLETMEEWERRLVAGFLVNRFRGDASLLAAAHEYVLRFTGKPVLGVVPYLPHLNVPQEDSVEFKSGNGESAPTRPDAVEIVIVDLPHISNFTDFDPLRLEPDVRLRVVSRAEDLGTPDAVILPGSKNVPGDLAALVASGLGAKIGTLARDGRTGIVGICGGFQMLGRTIADPHGLEAGTTAALEGLGWLEVTTVLEHAKTLTQTAARHLRSNEPVNGYEIHHGVTDSGSALPVFRTADGREAGVGTADGRIWGTYLHGVFDADGFRRVFLDDLRTRKGLAPLRTICANYEIETALNQLADVVRHAVDMKQVYQLMGL